MPDEIPAGPQLDAAVGRLDMLADTWAEVPDTEDGGCRYGHAATERYRNGRCRVCDREYKRTRGRY